MFVELIIICITCTYHAICILWVVYACMVVLNIIIWNYLLHNISGVLLSKIIIIKTPFSKVCI